MDRQHRYYIKNQNSSNINKSIFVKNIISVVATTLILIVSIIGLYFLLKDGSVDISTYNKWANFRYEEKFISGIFEKIEFIWNIISAIITVISLVISSIALYLTFQGGNINISTYSRGGSFEYEETFINNKINIDLIQPKIEKTFSEMSVEEFKNLDLSDYNSFGTEKRLEYPGTSMALIDTSYLYINNTGKFSESDVIIQFESDDIYFEEKYGDNLDTDTTQNKDTIEKETNYEFELFDYWSKSGYAKFRIKLNPGGYLYSGLTERIMLDDIFNGKVNWFYERELENGKATVPVKVTIASEKYKAKTFNINLNISEEE
ncbi:MAG: hypothetical protein SOT71_05370 [Romboutsia timonensis]|uniref:hypothetical protein n=1 Tax=Romboutsia timonensis TaxID=1776391 RepID=UPI002A75C6E2|nr:hypothetical protein [Romboutsia timonensis]MDY2882065.1 hypothetical protein [Romboutsia timonensis]